MKKPNVVHIEVMAQDNKSVQQRYRFVAEDKDGKTKGVTFTPEGVDHIINTFVTKFEMDNPGHQYRLVELAGAKFRLVWGDHKPAKKSMIIQPAVPLIVAPNGQPYIDI